MTGVVLRGRRIVTNGERCCHPYFFDAWGLPMKIHRWLIGVRCFSVVYVTTSVCMLAPRSGQCEPAIRFNDVHNAISLALHCTGLYLFSMNVSILYLSSALPVWVVPEIYVFHIMTVNCSVISVWIIYCVLYLFWMLLFIICSREFWVRPCRTSFVLCVK